MPKKREPKTPLVPEDEFQGFVRSVIAKGDKPKPQPEPPKPRPKKSTTK